MNSFVIPWCLFSGNPSPPPTTSLSPAGWSYRYIYKYIYYFFQLGIAHKKVKQIYIYIYTHFSHISACVQSGNIVRHILDLSDSLDIMQEILEYQQAGWRVTRIWRGVKCLSRTR